MNIYEQINRNRHTTWIVIFVVVSFFLFIGLGFDRYYGSGVNVPVFTLIALLVGLGASLVSYFQGDKLVLASTHARDLDLANPKESQWHNVVGEMCIAAGINQPKMFVIDDPDPNAFATGRDPAHASIAVTAGLLDKLNRDELQAVAAHEIGHIKNFDIRLMLMVAVLVGAIALLSDWAARSMLYGRRREGGASGGGRSSGGLEIAVLIVWLITVVLAPLLSRIMAMFVSRRREYLADASGAELTRNPIALANALEKIDSCAGPTRSISSGTAHLCIADPKGRAINSREGWWADLFATHPPIAKRVEALKKMAYAG